MTLGMTKKARDADSIDSACWIYLVQLFTKYLYVGQTATEQLKYEMEDMCEEIAIALKGFSLFTHPWTQ